MVLFPIVYFSISFTWDTEYFSPLKNGFLFTLSGLDRMATALESLNGRCSMGLVVLTPLLVVIAWMRERASATAFFPRYVVD